MRKKLNKLLIIINTGYEKIYTGAFFLCTILGVFAQEVVWQKDIKSNTQDFLSQVITTIDGQYLITGSSIHPSTGSESAISFRLQTVSRIMATTYIWLN
ncbi:hypothetical protein [Chryseobacterium wanjuense]